MVYYGFWYHAKMDALMAFIREAQQPVTGEVSLDLYKGNIIVAGRSSPNSLYDEGIATMEGGGSYNQTDAEGFLRIQGLPGRVQARAAAAEVLSGVRSAVRTLRAIWGRDGLRRIRIWSDSDLPNYRWCAVHVRRNSAPGLAAGWHRCGSWRALSP